MALTYVQYVGNGSTKTFNIPFPFLQNPHIKAKLNGTDLHTPMDYSWTGPAELTFEWAPSSLEVLEIYRETPYTENLVEFQNGANLTKEELNLAVRQLLYIFQEYNERVRELIDGAAINVATGGGLVPVDGNDIFDDIVAHILDQYLSDTLQQRLADINNNAESIIDQALAFTDVQATVDEATAVVGTFEDGLTTAQDTLTALQATVAGLTDYVNTDIQNLITQEVQDRIDGDTAIITILDLIGSISGDGTAFVLDLDTTMIGPTESLAQRLTAITADHDLNAAAIITESTARATSDDALATSVAAVAASSSANAASIVTEQTARADGDTALSNSLAVLTADVGTNTAGIVAEQIARADADTALASDITVIGATAASNTALIGTEQTARADGDSALSDSITTLSATSAAGDSTNAAAIVDEQTARIAGDNAEAAARLALGVIVGDNTAAVATETAARISGDTAVANSVAALSVEVDANTSGLVTEATARADADTAEANARLALAVIVGDNEAAIDTEATTRANADTALSSSISATSAIANANTAAILAETTARADADNATALQITGIISDVGDNAAAIVTNASTAASETQAVADDVTALGVTVAANTAGIITEQTARANADASLASDITTVTAAVNGNAAQIITESTARAAADAVLATDVTNLEARYGVKLNVNGYVTGFVQNNDGVTGEFKILTDVFRLIDPAGSSGQAGVEVFHYANGLITMQNVKIGTAVIDNLSVTTGKLADNAASVVSSAYTASDITIDTGYLGLKDVQTLTHTSSGGAVTVMASVSVANANSQDITGWGGIMRSDGSYLYGLTSFYFPAFSSTMLSFSATETPGSGAETYTLRVGNAINALNLIGRYRSLIALENIK